MDATPSLQSTEGLISYAAFKVFPEEVWGLILDEVKDSKDACNLIKAFPEVGRANQGKKHRWLLGKILPMIITRARLINGEDVRNCRLVCKTWAEDVGNFLLQQPHFKPFNPELISLTELNANLNADLRKLEENPPGWSRYWMNHIKGVVHLNQGSVLEFREEMEELSSDMNPFLTRGLSLGYNSGVPNAAFLENVFQVLRKFGGHVRFLRIRIVEITDKAAIFNSLVFVKQVLCLLPNLESLRLQTPSSEWCTAMEPKVGGLVEKIGLFFPTLGHLESLRINSPSIAARFAFRYRDQLRKLHLMIDFVGLVDTCTFPNLTELIIESEFSPSESPKKVRDILAAIHAPNLVKLYINIWDIDADVGNPAHFFVEEDMFKWLKRFPKLQLLDMFTIMIYISKVEEKGMLSPEEDSIPSLKFLTMHDYDSLSYKFLLCLPSLQHLQLNVRGGAELVPVDLSNEPVLKIRDEIQTGNLYFSNVWELLPNLETITLLMWVGEHRSEIHSVYSRERYEFLKREKMPLYDPDRVRPDIREFLEGLERP